MPKPAAFLGGALTATGIFGVIITIVELTSPQFWYFLFYLGIGILGGFSLGSVSAVYQEKEKNAYLTLTGFMLAALILLTVFLIIWQSDNKALGVVIDPVWTILIAGLSGLLTYIGSTLMSVGDSYRR
ncbi:MAG: hypothetical protein ACTSVB_05270 [Candidatus Heimdallarchaeaceae archaeon]|nr:MAG: hypothetical protein DRN69_08355 [Candidatus Pacearchaeota archaeon]